MYENAIDKIMGGIVLYILSPLMILLTAVLLSAGGYAIYHIATSAPKLKDEYIKHCIAHTYENYTAMQPAGKVLIPATHRRKVCAESENRVRIDGVMYRITGLEIVK